MTKLHRCDGCKEDIKGYIYKVVTYPYELVRGHDMSAGEKSFCGLACIAKWIKAHPEAEDVVVKLNRERLGKDHEAEQEGD